MSKLTTPDGQELDDAGVQQTFAESMAAPEPDEPTAPAPPRKDEEPADHSGRTRSDRAADAEAGRKHGRARTTASRAGQSRGGGRRQAKAEASAPTSYAKPVSEFLQALTITGALAPIPKGPVCVRVRLQAALVSENTPGLTKAIDAAAQNNAVIRRAVESITMGPSGWVLPAVLAVAPFAAQSVALWRTPLDNDAVQAAAEFEASVREMLEQAEAQFQADMADAGA